MLMHTNYVRRSILSSIPTRRLHRQSASMGAACVITSYSIHYTKLYDKMDGIQLVRNVKELPEKPFVLVISGYDDFNYAVEVLRNGVKDYLLKPVERDKFYAVIP